MFRSDLLTGQSPAQPPSHPPPPADLLIKPAYADLIGTRRAAGRRFRVRALKGLFEGAWALLIDTP